MSAKEYFEKEKTKLRELPFKKKIEYIWEYYKFWILGICFSFFLIISILTTIFNNSSNDSILYTAFLGTQLVTEDHTSLDEDFIKYAGLEDTDSYLTLDISMNIDREANDLYSLNANQKLIALIAATSIDVIVSDEENFLYLANSGGYQDLKDILPVTIFEKYRSSFYYISSSEDQENHPYGIYLYDSAALEKDSVYPDGKVPILGIPANVVDTKTAVLFLEFLLGE